MKNRRSWFILQAAGLLLAAVCFGSVFADDAVPGTAADPVVSKSYMDAQIEILQTQNKALQEQIEKLQEQIEKLSASSGASETPQAPETQETPQTPETPETPETPQTPETPAAAVEIPKFVVIKVDADQSVIGDASAEIILRSGTATAIAGASGGVADITAGRDLSTGTEITKNHLLLVPVDDGRGIRCTSTCYVMVKGDYKLQ